jgi:hypothetical protein
MAQVVEHLSSKKKTLSSISNTARKKNGEKADKKNSHILFVEM